MNSYQIIPSGQQFKSAPEDDQNIQLTLEQQAQSLVEFDRSVTVSLAEVYDTERQASTKFRPTFKVSYLYDNIISGTTEYGNFRNNLFYVDPQASIFSNVWGGFPQYYELDFFRNDVSNTHIGYKSVSAYTYNWDYYITYPSQNNYNKRMNATLDSEFYDWIVSEGIPFKITNNVQNGSGILSFECIAPHGLTPGESVELLINGEVFSYRNQELFEVYSLGNDLFNSEPYIFNLYNIGYTGTTLGPGTKGTFRRVVNFDNPLETKSKYYVRQHKVILKTNDLIITKSGFEKNPFLDEKRLEFSSLTPNKITRISIRNNSNAYTVTPKRDINIVNYLDNQLRPITELYLTIINKGYSGYFNKPFGGYGLKQGWEFNITNTNNPWWGDDNYDSNAQIPVSSYTQTDIVTKTFYYNQQLNYDDLIDGDFCEWNDFYQVERIVSRYFQKIKFNQDNFKTTNGQPTNAAGYYYNPHNAMTIRVFSDYIETADSDSVDLIPTYSYFSIADQQFRWRDLYQYGFFDQLGRGVNFPFMNDAQYPFDDFIFRLIPDDAGYDKNDGLTGLPIPVDPLIDKCE
jgi:hypothetical protein